MKRFILLAILTTVITSFCTADDYPCHPNGDMGPCVHRVHSYDYDAYGNVYPCTHPLHTYDIYACTHVCW